MSSWAAPEGAKGCWQWAALNTARNSRVCVCVCLLPFCSRQKKRKGNKFLFFGVYLCVGEGGALGVWRGLSPFCIWLCLFFTFSHSSFSCFFLCRGPFSVWHKPFPYCFNKHLKCLAPNLCTLYTQTVSHNQHQPAHLWQPLEGESGGNKVEDGPAKIQMKSMTKPF